MAPQLMNVLLNDMACGPRPDVFDRANFIKNLIGLARFRSARYMRLAQATVRSSATPHNVSS